jgi:hypothetical protein
MSRCHLFILLVHNNLGFIFNSNLTFSQHNAASKSCFYHIRDIRRIRNTIDHTTACTIATALIHSKLDYCHSLLLNLPSTQTERLQPFLDTAARAVTKTPKFRHIFLFLNLFTAVKRFKNWIVPWLKT